jgi:hypothetical protein
MTERKSLKKRVRARMEKTGERYTTARMHVAREPEEAARPQLPDETVRAATGRGWDEWRALLDEWGAADRTHTEIARHLREEHGVSGWWAQGVTVGYERLTGRRAAHQMRDGFAVSASKTFPVAAERLHAAFVDPDERRAWLEDGTLTVRTEREPRSARFDWEDGATRVLVDVTAKGPAKATATVTHERLPDADEAEAAKLAWRARLARLAEHLAR